MKLRPTAFALLITTAALSGGCDQIASRLGLEDPSSKEAKADAEGRAVGSACRQSGRAIEDCYSIYNWLPKSSIFAGWRDMNDYMQTNKLEIVEPKLPPPPPPGAKKKKAAEPVDEKKAEDGAKAPEGKGDAKAEPKGEGKSEAKAEDKTAKAGDAKAAKPENKAAAKH